MTNPETTAIEVARLAKLGNYSAAAYRLVRVPDNGRRTLVRLRAERLLTEAQQSHLSRCLLRFDSDEDVDQGPADV